MRHLQKGLIQYFQPLHQLVEVVEVQETRLTMLVELVALVVELATRLVVLETHILVEQEMKVDIHPQKETTEAVMPPMAQEVLVVEVVVQAQQVLPIPQV